MTGHAALCPHIHMVTNYNSDTTKEIVAAMKASTAKDIIPNQLAEKIVPVVDVNPAHNRKIDTIKYVTAAGQTFYTTPANKQDFYLCGINIGIENTNLAQTGYTYVAVNQNNATLRLCPVKCTGLVGGIAIANVVLELIRPIKVDRNSAIILTTSGSVNSAVASLWGYHVDSE